MKKILAMAAVAALAAGESAYAANPFADVFTSDWAYMASSIPATTPSVVWVLMELMSKSRV